MEIILKLVDQNLHIDIILFEQDGRFKTSYYDHDSNFMINTDYYDRSIAMNEAIKYFERKREQKIKEVVGGEEVEQEKQRGILNNFRFM